jgi:hypothetical protein
MERAAKPARHCDKTVRDLAHWRSRPVEERLAEIERLRLEWLSLHAPAEIDAPMVKVCRVVRKNKPAA